jgi:hypothetical protein
MAENKVRSVQRVEKRNIFRGLENLFKGLRLFEEGIPFQYLPKTLFVTSVMIFYIGNSHHAERTVRQIERLKVEVEDIRADYTTLKAEVMYASKQSEVARKTAHMEMEESLQPPYKIIVRN